VKKIGGKFWRDLIFGEYFQGGGGGFWREIMFFWGAGHLEGKYHYACHKMS
jgi:hypothetical protein